MTSPQSFRRAFQSPAFATGAVRSKAIASLVGATVFSSVLALASCGRAPRSEGSSGSETSKLADIAPSSDAERASLIAKARVWSPGDVASKDILAGPEGTRTWRVGQTIACTFEEPKKDDPMGGRTEKFRCVDSTGESLKVKYGLRNGEVAAEVAASRLLWALGFAADRNYPVRVECKNCPAEPWTYISDFQSGRLSSPGTPVDRIRADAYKRADRIFIPALVEKKFSGEDIERRNDQGWSFSELFANPSSDPTERVRREALVILMGVLQHADSKAEQQRLMCPKAQVVGGPGGSKTCAAPVLVVHDLGWTFGSGWALRDLANISKMKLDDWRATGVWADRDACVVRINEAPGGTLRNTKVSREARDFLSGLLGALTRKQKEDLFRAARVDLQYPVSRSIAETEERVRAWANALDAKIADVASAPCTR